MITPVSMYPIQQGSSWLPTDTKEHLRYFGSPFKCTDEYGWFTLSDAHYEWFCLPHATHHVFSGSTPGTSGFELAEAWTYLAFASDGHSSYTKDLDNYRMIWNYHDAYALNDGYAQYIDLTE